ncbi:MAG: rod shape-determining protein RodA [Candidatus Omnitrophota bacterium]|nr:rod shape-determining protein RodA [Candidatus Omnitrophota bacterium]
MKRYKDFDKLLPVMAFLIFAIGVATIYSATKSRGLPIAESFFFKQLSWMGIGIALLVLAISISYQRFIDIAYIIYGLNIILLVLVLILGHIRLGAQRWFSIAGFAFQPSEFIKLSLILALSNYTAAKKDSMSEFRNLIVPSILLIIPFALVLLQPDLGTALLLVPIFFSVMVVSGARLKYLGIMILAGLAGLPVFWHFLRDYQRQRLLVFVNPNIDPLGAGYTIIQSKIAVGSGGLWGKGWMNGTQNQLNFLPERHTDFIFSVIGEEWGFLGALALVLMYFFIVRRAFNISALTSDLYGKTIASGIGVMIGLQVVINIAMTIGLMPVVGIPLPLVSYGGSSLIATVVAIGLLINVGIRRSTF